MGRRGASQEAGGNEVLDQVIALTDALRAQIGVAHISFGDKFLTAETAQSCFSGCSPWCARVGSQ